MPWCETAFHMALLVGTYAWKFRVVFSEGQESVGDQVVFKTPAEIRKKKLESAKMKSQHVAEVPAAQPHCLLKLLLIHGLLNLLGLRDKKTFLHLPKVSA